MQRQPFWEARGFGSVVAWSDQAAGCFADPTHGGDCLPSVSGLAVRRAMPRIFARRVGYLMSVNVPERQCSEKLSAYIKNNNY